MTAKELRRQMEVQGFNLSIEFEENFIANWRHYLTSSRQIKGVIKMCEYWKPYISQEEFERLVEQQILNFDRLECTVLSTERSSRAYIGNYIKVYHELPNATVTKVNPKGEAYKAEGFGRKWKLLY